MGSWMGTGIGAQARADHVAHAQEIRAGAIHLVDEGDARHVVAVHLPPHRLGLRLHAGHRIEQRYRAVEHAQGALDFDGEVHVPGRVDDVDAVLGEGLVHPLPEAGGRGRRDRDAAFLFLLHVIHDGRAVMDLADLVRHARVEKDALGRRRLPGVDVRRNSDVPIVLDGRVARHELKLTGIAYQR